jgi:integration host factor subunit alpha
MTITKADLSALLVDQLGLNQRESKEMVELFFMEISAVLESGGMVKLAGFGVFSSRDKPERPGRNPKTGEETPISARRVVTWHPSAGLKSAVDASTHLNLSKKSAA